MKIIFWLLASILLNVSANTFEGDGQIFVTPNNKECILTGLSGDTLFSYAPVEQRQGGCYNFKPLDNGNWIFFNDLAHKWEEHPPFSDEIIRTYEIIGSDTDLHDILIFNQYVWLMGTRTETVEFNGSLIQIEASTLQKQALDGTVLFDWNSVDHISLSEATVDPLLISFFPHANGFVEDEDGNLIVSFRNTSSLMKLCVVGECQPGEIIWRLGGTQSDFVFVDDPGFSMQHSPSLPTVCYASEKCLLLFDNGNGGEPARSRAVEYALDESAFTATRTWEYSDGVTFSPATGNAYRLPDGNTVIGWGRAPTVQPDAPIITVVDFDKNVLFEAGFARLRHIASYRVYFSLK